MRLSNYDAANYDYKTYWRHRGFEDFAEKNYLNKAFQDFKGDWFIDIGGSYGRNSTLYAQKYRNFIILDYSLQTLINNRKEIQHKFKNAILIAANAYNLPFRDSCIDGALMVRVLHHIEKPEVYFKELGRVLTNNGLYIQEFANKVHIKARLRAWLKRDKAFFTEDSYQQPTQGYYEGSAKKENVFLNFHPKAIQRLLIDQGFQIIDQQGVSYLRIPLIKKLLPQKVLHTGEKVMQKALKNTYISPSIFYLSRLSKDEKTLKNRGSIEDILACPKCKQSLNYGSDYTQCVSCGEKYFKKEGVWDLRVT